MASTNIQSFSGDVIVTSNLAVDTNTLHVDSVTGRIGIGKTDPAFAFDVGGIVNATSFYLGGSELQGGKWTESGSDIYYTTGAVGIGTNSPAKTLEVQGTLRVSNATTGKVSDLLVTKSTIWGQKQKITASDAAQNDQFGYSVAISSDGNTAIVGARYEDPGGVSAAGSAYIFTRSGSSWSEQQKIENPQPAQDDYFGTSVAISGDGNTALVGAYYDDPGGINNAGSAYIFTRSGGSWSQQANLTTPNPATYGQFGKAVAISGTTALVGAPYEAPGGVTNGGSVYIFTYSGGSWSEQQRITSSDLSAGDGFGDAVAISSDGTTAIVGVYLSSPGGVSGAGSAYIFTYSGGSWSEQQKIPNPDPATSDLFGYSVAMSGDGNTAIMGVRQEDPDGVNTAGSAYIFTRSGTSWSEQVKLTASDKAAYDFFGCSVAISGDGNTALVGANGNDPDGVDTAGSAYIFTRSGTSWSQEKITASDRASSDSFGLSVAISSNGKTVLVGALGDDSSAGSAYIFTLTDTLTSTTSITAQGTILSFTGQHMCFPDGPMGQGQIVSANKNKYITLNGPLTTGARAINSSESLPVVCLSNVVNDKNVFGVVDRHEQSGTKRVQKSGIGRVTQEKEWGDNRVIVNSIGEGAMWVANTNGNLVSGNYITTSNIAGYGQKQDDNKLHSYTVAKITMDCDFEPEDLPVQVIKKDAEGNNTLDTYGRIQWEDTDRTEKAYRIRYLTTEGRRTDQANAVWTAAYVGCTYHCG